jgi:hypothetical protein
MYFGQIEKVKWESVVDYPELFTMAPALRGVTAANSGVLPGDVTVTNLMSSSIPYTM